MKLNDLALSLSKELEETGRRHQSLLTEISSLEARKLSLTDLSKRLEDSNRTKREELGALDLRITELSEEKDRRSAETDREISEARMEAGKEMDLRRDSFSKWITDEQDRLETMSEDLEGRRFAQETSLKESEACHEAAVQAVKELEAREQELERREASVSARDAALSERERLSEARFSRREGELARLESNLEERNSGLRSQEGRLASREDETRLSLAKATSQSNRLDEMVETYSRKLASVKEREKALSLKEIRMRDRELVYNSHSGA